MSGPWDGDDIPLETEDEFRSRSGHYPAVGGARTSPRGAGGARTSPRGAGGARLELDTSTGPPVRSGRGDQRPRPADAQVPASGRLAPLCGLLLLALLGWEVGAGALQKETAASDADWRAAAAELRSLRKPGEPVLIAPFWAEPAGRVYLDGVLDLELATLSDVDRYGRIFELSIRGARHPFLRKLEPKQRTRHGAVTLAFYEQKPAEVLYDFRDRLANAEVSTRPPRRGCTRSGKRFFCGPGQEHWVGPHLAEVAHRPYHCIYAYPASGRRLSIDFPAVPIGSRLVAYTGIDDFENRKKAKGDVRLQILMDDKIVGGVLHQNDWPWYRIEADTSALAGKARRVRFEVTSDRPLFRTFCFHAEVRR